jgi:hypothetical protein
MPDESALGESMFKLMGVLLTLLLCSPVALAAQVNLLCNEGRGPDLKTVTAVYDKTTLTTPTGTKTTYAITDIFFVRSFLPASVVTGAKGQNLAIGECGLATSILQGVSHDPTSLPTITLRGFQTYTDSVTTFNAPSGAITTFLNGQAVLPPCSTNIYQFVAEQSPNPNLFDVVGDANVTCVAP